MRRTRNTQMTKTVPHHPHPHPSFFTSIQVILSMFDRMVHEYTLTDTVHYLHAHFSDKFGSNHNRQFYLGFFFSFLHPVTCFFFFFILKVVARSIQMCLTNIRGGIIRVSFSISFCMWQMWKVERLLHKYSMRIGERVGWLCLPL